MKTLINKSNNNLIVKTLIFTLANLLIITSLRAQSPEKMSYQAVIRDASANLITNTQVGMQISILQGSANGTAVYVETQEPTTNANGLVNIEIGTGTTNDDFSTIGWTNGPYFLKTETDPEGGTNYTISGTNQLLSVPFAFHAKTSETVTGEINETDPVFSAWDKSEDIIITESQISDLGNYIETETDPGLEANFDFTDAQSGDLLQFDGSKWVKVTPGYISDYTVTESDVTEHEAALTITESQISDLGNYIETETDPGLEANFDFTDAQSGDLLQFDGSKWVRLTPDYISDYTVTESDVTEHEAALTITESQISDLGTYLETETDPSVPAGNQTGDMQYWDGSEWITLEAGGEGQILTFVDGVPTWTTLVGATTLKETDVYNPSTGKIWMDRNLGASQVATSSSNIAAYGDLYQWGRAADGHESRSSDNYDGDANGKPSTYDENGAWNGKFITTNTNPYDWLTTQDDDLWQGVNGTNNPCPDGYRLPTEAEWLAELDSWDSIDAAGAFASPLKLPAAGYRNHSSGSISSVGFFGAYWSSTVIGTHSSGVYFDSTIGGTGNGDRANGQAVRCLRD